MYYTSTRDKSIKTESAVAITHGISKEGGLFVPLDFPKISVADIEEMTKLTYIDRARKILSLYLTDFSSNEISYCCNGAYSGNKFSSEKVAPTVKLYDNVSILELFHGPTCAFKDMALQLLPFLLTVSAGKVAKDKKIVILVATSGDTGKAALEGFKNVPNTEILVFYPSNGVSPMQKLQMTTQDGNNVGVCAINGNFDDAQTGVKKIFTDSAVAEKLDAQGMMFSSANSINWGRLVPQIVYYFSTYCDLVENKTIKNGEKINIAVPTGNFGNILAAYYAYKMGLPVNKFICASNANNVLTDFLTTGTYDKNRNFMTTLSPSMDILISSNLERLLFDLTGNDDKKVSGWMENLKDNGKYTVDDDVLKKLKELFSAGFCDDEETAATIKSTFIKNKYLCDTHTAVAVNVYNNYRKTTGDTTPAVIASTASPFKFSKSVLKAVTEKNYSVDEFSMTDELSRISDRKVPLPLAELKNKKVRFFNVCESDNMEETVLKMLSKKG